jgi:hypothetical protein
VTSKGWIIVQQKSSPHSYVVDAWWMFLPSLKYGTGHFMVPAPFPAEIFEFQYSKIDMFHHEEATTWCWLLSRQVESNNVPGSVQTIAIFVHIGIGKVGKLFSNQGNPLFWPEPEYFYARVKQNVYFGTNKNEHVLFFLLYRGTDSVTSNGQICWREMEPPIVNISSM